MNRSTAPDSPSFIAIERVLIDRSNFRPACEIDDKVPCMGGLYCIRIRDIGAFPEPFGGILRDRSDDIIYIGKAADSLKRRFLNQELRANGHGTFFRSIGAVLGYRPPAGSLLGHANTRNYKFAPPDQCKIIHWINAHLLVNWREIHGECDPVETALIQKYQPLLNLAKNPKALDDLKCLRRKCVVIANQK